jgi:hypothetical protein
MNFLDGHLFPENQQPLIITAAPYAPSYAPSEYSLSKSTRVYAQVGYVDNKGTMNQTIVYGTPVAPGVSTSAAMIGIRHSF